MCYFLSWERHPIRARRLPTHLFPSIALPGSSGQNSYKFQGLPFSQGRGEPWEKRWLQSHIFTESNKVDLSGLHLGPMNLLPDGSHISLNKQCQTKNIRVSTCSSSEHNLCRRGEPGAWAWAELWLGFYHHFFLENNQLTGYHTYVYFENEPRLKVLSSKGKMQVKFRTVQKAVTLIVVAHLQMQMF